MTRTRIRVADSRKNTGVERVLRGRLREGEKPKEKRSPFSRYKNPIARFFPHKPQTEPFRDGDYMHVSDLLGKCTRHIALSKKNKLPMEPQTIWSSQRLIFRSGSLFHDLLKLDIQKGGGELFGTWRCGCGETKSKKPGVAADFKNLVCSNCRSPLSIYDELHLVDHDAMIVGHADLALIEGGWLYLAEIKSISSNQFRELTRPSSDHRAQLYMYARMARLMGYNVHPSMSVFYVCREWTMENPFKEFVLEYDEAAERMIAPYVEEAKTMAQFKKGGPLPARTLCGQPNAPRAKKCPVVMFCFRDG